MSELLWETHPKLTEPGAQDVMRLLGEAWNAYQALPVVHPWHQQEFMSALHHAQYIVVAREAWLAR